MTDDPLFFKPRCSAELPHDLATPISGLGTRIYLLKRSPQNLNVHIDALENQVEHLRKLLEDLRTVSRLDRGKLDLVVDFFDVNEIAQRIFDTYEPVAISKQQLLTLTVAPDVPKLLMDGRQIERVLVNLVANAVHYTPSNRAIRIFTVIDDEYVSVSVADEGMGISSEDLPHIFDRFYRGANAHKSVASGTGLGLAISKEIVELHGGTISVESSLAEGSTFTLRIPRKE